MSVTEHTARVKVCSSQECDSASSRMPKPWPLFLSFSCSPLLLFLPFLFYKSTAGLKRNLLRSTKYGGNADQIVILNSMRQWTCLSCAKELQLSQTSYA